MFVLFFKTTARVTHTQRVQTFTECDRAGPNYEALFLHNYTYLRVSRYPHSTNTVFNNKHRSKHYNIHNHTSLLLYRAVFNYRT